MLAGKDLGRCHEQRLPARIGGGSQGSCGTVRIAGGTVTATATGSSTYASGIGFGDDGTCNVHIYGNRVVRVEGTFCIDLRMFRRVGWMKGSRVHDPNTGNVMYGNIIDGRCRFRIRRSDPTSHKGANIKL